MFQEAFKNQFLGESSYFLRNLSPKVPLKAFVSGLGKQVSQNV